MRETFDAPPTRDAAGDTRDEAACAEKPPLGHVHGAEAAHQWTCVQFCTTRVPTRRQMAWAPLATATCQRPKGCLAPCRAFEASAQVAAGCLQTAPQVASSCRRTPRFCFHMFTVEGCGAVSLRVAPELSVATEVTWCSTNGLHTLDHGAR
jgi:hypothetical protein